MASKPRRKSATADETMAVQELVEGNLRSVGYNVARIPPSKNARRADLLATRETERLIVEVTSKRDDGEYDRALQSAGLALHTLVIAQHGATTKALRGKNAQIRSTPQSAETVRLIWLEAVGPFRESIAQQIEATFYGRVSVPVNWSASGTVETKHKYCYFFDHAACFSMGSVDAILVGYDGKTRMLLNPRDEARALATRETHLAQILNGGGAFVSPFDEEKAGAAFLAHDFPGDRRDDRALEDFMERKYSVRPFLALRMNMMTAGAVIPGKQP